MHLLIAIIFLPSLLYSSTMTIKGESLSWNREKRLLVITKNVVLNKGSITLKADIVELKGEIENPEKIICKGNVIVFDEERNATIKAKEIEIFLKEKMAYCKRVEISYKNRRISGNSGTYNGKTHIAQLNGSCTMNEDGRSFSSEIMRYFIDREHIEFSGNVKGYVPLK